MAAKGAQRRSTEGSQVRLEHPHSGMGAPEEQDANPRTVVLSRRRTAEVATPSPSTVTEIPLTTAKLDAAANQEPSGPPEDLICPLTHELMVDPVMLYGSGQTYERAPIERWLATHDTDPMTGVLLDSPMDKTLRENVLVRKQCRKYNA